MSCREQQIHLLGAEPEGGKFMKVDKQAIADLAPTGVVRAAINLGNPLLAKQIAPGTDPYGLSVDLAAELSRRLEISLKFVCFPGAGKVFEAATAGVWDIAFLAIDPERSKEINFTSPYVTLSGSFVVRAGSDITRNEEVDQKGIRVVVGKGSAYDLYLSGALKNAEVVRVATSEAVIAIMVRNGYEAAAGVRQPLEEQLAHFPALRLLDGRFMTIHQAMAARKGSTLGIALLQAFIEEMKESGFVERSLNRHGVEGVSVAGPAS